MTSNYYDLDDILSDGEKIPCKFNITVPGLGYLEGNPGKAIHKDTRIDLPLWLAGILAICEVLEDSQQRFVDLMPPDFISPKVLNALKTNASNVDLHSVLTNFYKLTEKWASMFNDAELSEIAMQLFKERAYEINNFASNANVHINNQFMYSLDEFEKHLYKLTADSYKEMKHWLHE